jgi:hypothetical protein
MQVTPQASATRIATKALRTTALAMAAAVVAAVLVTPLSASSYRHRHATPPGPVSETIYRPGCATHQGAGLIDDCDFLVETHDPECRGD